MGQSKESGKLARPWREIEIELTAAKKWSNPYTDVEAWVDFEHDSGRVIRRPAFWDGGASWKVRFASPVGHGAWKWRSAASVDDSGLSGVSGEVQCAPAEDEENLFYRRGFWKMSKGGRNLVHADGTPCMLAGDTVWALPWRATPEQCTIYAADRQQKGYNAALLMTVQPDMDARGPRDRTKDTGFDVGFEDLERGHLNEINVEYFQRFDELCDILVAHEIVPVYQPLFHGYGWKGLRVAGLVVSPEEYARYCRYLVARFGARPAMWLVGGDGDCKLESIRAAGAEIEAWDAYGQPTGLHYRPHARADAWQEADWLDFQWCQTGHSGLHLPERVADMWRNRPIKAVANGEPTYEHIGEPGRATDWWQGEEAWANLCAGGTMGAVYGAGSLWQWRLHKNEPDYEEWAHARLAGWREAIDFPGSKYVGAMRKIFDGLPFADMEPDWESVIWGRGLSVPGKLLVLYMPEPVEVRIPVEWVPSEYRVFDPKTAEEVGTGTLEQSGPMRVLRPGGEGPKVYVFCVSW